MHNYSIIHILHQSIYYGKALINQPSLYVLSLFLLADVLDFFIPNSICIDMYVYQLACAQYGKHLFFSGHTAVTSNNMYLHRTTNSVTSNIQSGLSNKTFTRSYAPQKPLGSLKVGGKKLPSPPFLILVFGIRFIFLL